MKILYIGGGYVGACSAAVAADSGHNVIVYDIDQEKIGKYSTYETGKIESCIFEEGLAELIIKNRNRLQFSSDLPGIQNQLDNIEAVFMCLPTPEKDETGETNLSYYEAAVKDLGQVLEARNAGEQSQYILIINKSTVPLGMNNRAQEILADLGVKNFGVGSNPEFLVEGKAVEGSIRPQRIVVGAWQEKDFKIFRDIYKRFADSPTTQYIEVNPREAEAGKLLANYTLFNRLAVCFDVVGRTCEQFDYLRFENVRKVLISDARIGNWGFYDSLYAGGSCFIKDARSLAYQLQSKGVATDLVSDALGANQRQLAMFLDRPEKELNYDWTGKKIGILGLAFKRDTDDIRNSAAIGVVDFLLEKNVAQIKAFDPVAGQNFRKHYQNNDKLEIVENQKQALAEVDVIFITTDWPEFRELNGSIKDVAGKNALLMDGRRMLQHRYEELSEAGLDVIAVGSPLIEAKTK